MNQQDEEGSYSILIFEDDLDQHVILGKILEKEGFKAKFVTTSDKGLDLLKNEKFDAVLIDYNLAPESSKDGIETLKEIRKEDLSITVVMMTAFGTQELAIEAIKGQSDDFWIKPIDYSVLGKILRERIKNRRELFPQNYDNLNKQNLSRNLNIFDNFIILQNSIPMYIKGEWRKNPDKNKLRSNSSLGDQILMSSFLNAIQSLSKTIFGQNVNELALGEWKIIFKQKDAFLCGIKVKDTDFRYISGKKNNKEIIFSTLNDILLYLGLESKKSEIIRLNSSQIVFIENNLSLGFTKLDLPKLKKSLLKRLFFR